MTQVAIALGSNLGDSVATIRQALELLSDVIDIEAVSPLYRTAPAYVEDQPPFVNGALVAETTLGPWPLLRTLKRLEADLGREPGPRYGPRAIDLDLVAYGNLIYRFSDLLQIPHPRLAERAFVLRPLADIAPKLEIPNLGNVSELLARTPEVPGSVVKLEDNGILRLPRDR